MVTRSLVSYDPRSWAWCSNHAVLKGHQIIGELRLSCVLLSLFKYNWRVTRSLVSYDLREYRKVNRHHIEGSPDHWWVTTWLCLYSASDLWLKGHQIIGELRQIAGQLPLSVDVYIVVITSNATYFLIIYQQVIVVQLSAYFSSSANCKNFCTVHFYYFIFL